METWYAEREGEEETREANGEEESNHLEASIEAVIMDGTLVIGVTNQISDLNGDGTSEASDVNNGDGASEEFNVTVGDSHRKCIGEKDQG